MTAALIAKLESASEGSRGLGHEVLLHFGWHRSLVGHFYGPLYQWSAPDRKPCLISGDEDKLPNPVLSIDAALELAGRNGCDPSEILHAAWAAVVRKHALHMRQFDGASYTQAIALAICAAILRASAAEGAGHD